MKEIHLSNERGIVLVDDEYYDFISKYSWCFSSRERFAYRTIGSKKTGRRSLLLKRVIFSKEIEAFAKENNIPINEVIVHSKNLNQLDCRKCNLIALKNGKQNLNFKKEKKKGVIYIKRLNCYKVEIKNSESKNLEYLVKTEIEAKSLWNHLAREIKPDYCILFELDNEIPKEDIHIMRNEDKNKAIMMINNSVVQKYVSIKGCSEQLNLNRNTILRYLKRGIDPQKNQWSYCD